MRAQHELLQVSDPSQVPLLHSLKDPLPKPLYVALRLDPVDAVPVGGIVRGSVPRGRLLGSLRLRFSIQLATSRYLTCASVIVDSLIVFKGPPDPRGLPFGPDIASVSAGLCVAGEAPGSTFSPEISLQQHSLLGSSCSRKGFRPSLPPAYQLPLDPYGVVVFRSCQLRPKEDASYTPGPMVIAPF